VDDIVRSVSKLSADDFAEEKEPPEGEEEAVSPLKEYKLDQPQSKVIVDLKDGTSRILLIGDKSGYRHYVKREDKDTVFMLSKSKIDRLFKALEELKANVEEKPENEQERGEVESDEGKAG
jgi:hypothetical protein